MFYSSTLSSRSEEDIHESLIKTRIKELEKDDHSNIKTDHLSDYEKPDKIGDHIPDITSEKDNIFYITEAETKETIGTEETVDQWKAFASYGDITGDTKFHVVVPASCLEDAKKFAEENEIKIDFLVPNIDY